MIKIGRVELSEPLIDYYASYNLNRNARSSDLYMQLKRINGEFITNMSCASLAPEIVQKLQEQVKELEPAIKIFKNDDYRKDYDKELAKAYKKGTIDVEAQKMAQDLFAEIESLYLKGNYQAAMNKCNEALNNKVNDYRIYILLAQSYYALHNADQSLRVIDSGLQVHPNNLFLLRAGARFANEGKKDFDRAQKYINNMMEIDPESSLAYSEQSYLYLNEGKEDLAFSTIDKYMEKHPSDSEFRKGCAYDLLSHSYGFYTQDLTTGDMVIASKQDYEKNLETCEKAASLYSDDTIKSALNNAKFFGTTQFNYENLEGIMWLVVGGIVYSLSVVGLPLGLLLFFCAWRLRSVSYRPYWQINKFIMTGKREHGEGKYILIGNICTGYFRWGFRIAWWLIKLVFSFMAGGGFCF